MYTFKLVDPRRERTLWAAFAAGQRACCARYGAEGIPEAGARIHVRDAGHALPIELHFSDTPLLRSELERRSGDGVAEVGGLWAADGLGDTGIGAAIIAATAAHAPLLGVRHLIAFVHHHHRFNDAVGFHRDERFAARAYPDPRYSSVVRWCDTKSLDTADARVRAGIPEQRRAIARGERIRLDLPARAQARLAAIGA